MTLVMRKDFAWRLLRRLFGLFLTIAAFTAVPAYAQSCGPATTQGTAPAGWETYCWLDFTSYNDTTARSTNGQSFSFTLTDGSVLAFRLKVTPNTANAFSSVVAPSWTGAAVGNSAFLGIPGRPILYTQAAGTRLITISNIVVTPPSGGSVSTFAFVVADAESSNEGESIQFTTNGGAWQLLDTVDPISGSTYPTLTGTNTTTANIAGASGTVGSYILGSGSPTTVTANITAGGLQGVMFAVRFASIRIAKQIVGARINAADQFTYRIAATSSGTVLSSGTTTGTGNGPFTATTLSTASGLPLTLSEVMATGSVSTLSQYRGQLTCTNATTGSSTVLPNSVITSSYNFGALQYGDNISCSFTNTAYPYLRVRKALAATGRYFATDQFTMRIMNGATAVASSTSTGTGTTVTGGDTGLTSVTAGTAYTLDEIAAAGSLANYTSAMSCTNATNGVSTSFPTTSGSAITPQMGDVVTCVITNTKLANSAQLAVVKTSTVVSDGINPTNPKAIPGAVIRYTITVTNIGNSAVDASSIVLTDILPANFEYDASTPVTFTNGTTASGLNAFNASTMVTFSNQAGGGTPYTYSPGTGYNAAIRGVRIAPTGTMAAATSTTAQPSFSISYLGRVG